MKEIQKGDIYIHYKTKGLYEITGLATMQAREESLDMKKVVIYKSLQDELVWVREVDYFSEEVSPGTFRFYLYDKK